MHRLCAVKLFLRSDEGMIERADYFEQFRRFLEIHNPLTAHYVINFDNEKIM